MIQHAIDLKINRPVQDVFAFVTDEKNHSKWDKLSVVMEPQEKGSWRPGLKFREVRKLGGRDKEVFSQIEVLEPNQRMEIQSVTGPYFHGSWKFEPTENGTRLLYQAQMKMGGPMKLLEPLIARPFKKQLEENFARLKQVLEEKA